MALSQPTAQSSTRLTSPSEKAVDGNASPMFADESCTHTWQGGATDPWWAVQLPNYYCSIEVHITNRGDSECKSSLYQTG